MLPFFVLYIVFCFCVYIERRGEKIKKNKIYINCNAQLWIVVCWTVVGCCRCRALSKELSNIGFVVGSHKNRVRVAVVLIETNISKQSKKKIVTHKRCVAAKFEISHCLKFELKITLDPIGCFLPILFINCLQPGVYKVKCIFFSQFHLKQKSFFSGVLIASFNTQSENICTSLAIQRFLWVLWPGK